MIDTIYNEMRHADRAINYGSAFRFCSEIKQDGRIAVYLWSADYKDDYFKYYFDLEKDEPEKVLEAISFLIGYVRGYHAAEDKAKEVEFGPLEEVKPATVEAA
jgi:hypothetical protein